MLEGYIKKIEQVDGTTILTLEIVPPKKIGSPDIYDFGSEADFTVMEEQWKKWKEGYDKLIIEQEQLHLGLITLSQTRKRSDADE